MLEHGATRLCEKSPEVRILACFSHALPWIHHLGMKVSTVDGVGKFEVTPQRVAKIRRMAKDIIGRAFRSKREVSPRSVRQFCGLKRVVVRCCSVTVAKPVGF